MGTSPRGRPSEATPAQRWAAVAALLVAATFWSSSGTLIKLLHGGEGVPGGHGADGLHGVTIAFYRSMLAGAVFLPLAWRDRRTLRDARWTWPTATVAMFTLMTVCYVVANTQTTAANAIVLQNTAPVWVFALSPLLLGEKPRWTEAAVLALAMVGVAIIFVFGRGGDATGLIVALISGAGYGGLTVTLRGQRRMTPVLSITLNCLGSGVVLAPAVPFVGGFAIDGRELALLLTLSFVQFAIPYVLFAWALQRIEAYKATLIVLIEAVLNPALTLTFIGEVPAVGTLVGGPVILASVAGWVWLTARRRRAGTT